MLNAKTVKPMFRMIRSPKMRFNMVYYGGLSGHRMFVANRMVAAWLAWGIQNPAYRGGANGQFKA